MRPCSRHSAASYVGVVRIDDEVDGPQLVGSQRAAELHGAGDREVEAVDEHHDHEPLAHRRRDGLRNVVRERFVLGLVLLGQAHEQEDHDRARR